MFALKSLLPLSLLFAPLISAATVNCGDISTGRGILVSEVETLKATINSGQISPAVLPSLASGTSPTFRVGDNVANLQICIINRNVFQGTTVFPDEMIEFLDLNLACLDTAVGADGTMTGDTGATVSAELQRANERCGNAG